MAMEKFQDVKWDGLWNGYPWSSHPEFGRTLPLLRPYDNISEDEQRDIISVLKQSASRCLAQGSRVELLLRAGKSRACAWYSCPGLFALDENWKDQKYVWPGIEREGALLLEKYTIKKEENEETKPDCGA